MTENAVKLVAEAIRLEICGQNPRIVPYGDGAKVARAAIAALLKLLEEPTEYMVEEGEIEIPNEISGSVEGFDVAKCVFRRMLAAWRKEMGV